MNEEVLPWVTLQSAAAVVERAIRLRDAGKADEALALLGHELARLALLPASDLVADARRLLETAKQAVEEGDDQIYGSSRKTLRSMKRFYSMSGSADDSTLPEALQPSFKKPLVPRGKPTTKPDPTSGNQNPPPQP